MERTEKEAFTELKKWCEKYNMVITPDKNMVNFRVQGLGINYFCGMFDAGRGTVRREIVEDFLVDEE